MRPVEIITRKEFLFKTGNSVITAALLSSLGGGCAPFSSSGDRPYRSIDRSLCIGCGKCVSLCPMGAISLGEKSSIDPDECAECGACLRSGVCPAGAITAGSLQWPRVLREIFSNPLTGHKKTGVRGRGTDGIKCNDTEERYRRGEIAVFIEMGRPVMGARFRDVEKAVRLFKSEGFSLVRENPVYALIGDHTTGRLKAGILEEKVISCVLEFIMPESSAQSLMGIIKRLSAASDTVFNVCVALPGRPTGPEDVRRLFGDIFVLPEIKANIGLAKGIQGG